MNLQEYIEQHLATVDFDSITTVQAKTCQHFDELMDILKRDMSVTKSFEECFAFSAAVHICTKFDGDPLWAYLVGRPSSGKSTICELLTADEINSKPLSKFTGLVSGHTHGNHLLPKLHNKCVVVKDGTLLLESTPIQLANVYGELRDIYDGSLEADWRNGKSASFSNITFGLLIGITEKIYTLNMSALGERFLHCRLETTRESELIRNRNAVQQIWEDTRKTQDEDDLGDHRSFPTQREYTAGFLQHLHAKVRDEDIIKPTYTSKDANNIQAFADVVACSRAEIPTDKQDIALFRSTPEASTRVAKQLARTALGLCYVYGTKNVSNVQDLLRKVTIDSSHGRQYNMLKAVTLSEDGLSAAGIAAACEEPLGSMHWNISNLKALGVFEEAKQSFAHGHGRRANIITCPQWVLDAFRITHGTPRITLHETSKDKVRSSKKVQKPTGKKRPKPLPKKKGPSKG